MKNLLNTFKSSNFKGKTLAIALILVLTFSAATAILPHFNAQAHKYSYYAYFRANGLWNIPTFAGLTVAPNPVGVGQPVQVIMIIELLPPSIGIRGKNRRYRRLA